MMASKPAYQVPQPNQLMEAVGNTPLLPLRRLAHGLNPAIRLWAKAEWLNPTGSIKDRPASAILRAAVSAGAIEHGRVLLDSTSGNMGIAYATFGAALGARVQLAVPANASQIRLRTLRALGAELTLTDPLEGADGARLVAQSLAAEHPESYEFLDQYSNPANWQAHFETTGPEIRRQTAGRVTHIVAGLGTGGTATGVGRYFHQGGGNVELVAVQPDGPLHGLEGLKHYPTSPVPAIYDERVVDRVIEVATEAAYQQMRALAEQEGMLVGISSGAAVAAALHLASELTQADIVIILPDTGTRYLEDAPWLKTS